MNELVSCSFSLTRNLGNYNSMKIEASRTTEISPSESPEDAWSRIWAEVEAEIEKKSNEYELDN